ncbi:MAG: hypothetical protein AAF228_06775 [Pseudomonadota bacterium]
MFQLFHYHRRYALFILSLFTVSLISIQAHSSGLSRAADGTNTHALPTLLQKVEYRPISFCEIRRIECRRVASNNLEKFQGCLIASGCARGKVETRVKLETEKNRTDRVITRNVVADLAGPDGNYAEYPHPVRKPPFREASYYDAPPRHYRPVHHHNKRYYPVKHRHKHHYHKRKRHKKHYGYKHSSRASCRKWHRQCIISWGTNYSDYYGCMQYHYCKPRYYKKRRHYTHYPKRHYRKSYHGHRHHKPKYPEVYYDRPHHKPYHRAYQPPRRHVPKSYYAPYGYYY